MIGAQTVDSNRRRGRTEWRNATGCSLVILHLGARVPTKPRWRWQIPDIERSSRQVAQQAVRRDYVREAVRWKSSIEKGDIVYVG
jgi:hypothetical protein